jgi:hypothetical protein
MRVKKSRFAPALLVFALVIVLPGCATLSDIMGGLANLQRLKFRIGGVRGFTLAGVSLGGKARLSDLSLRDAGKLLAAFSAKRLAAGFVLEVEARNPNDGTGGSQKTLSTLTRFDWRLLLDDRETISGGIDRPIEIPGTGQTSVLPLRMEIDLYQFFAERGYEDLVDLAMALGGSRRDVSRISLDALPRVSTPLGEITWPNRITVVSHEFR